MSQLDPLPQLRFEVSEVARVLRISRATLYQRIREGRITTQKDGRRTFITVSELPLTPPGPQPPSTVRPSTEHPAMVRPSPVRSSIYYRPDIFRDRII
jgi:excisionase family DNA binding protein